MDFYIGKLKNNDNITWNGKKSDKTYDEIIKSAFTVNYSKLVIRPFTENNETDVDTERIALEEIFVPPNGFYARMKKQHMSGSEQIRYPKSFSIALVDPNKNNNIRIEGMENIIPNKQEHVTYKLEINVRDSSVYNGKTCTVYGKSNNTYGECIESTMREKLKSWYGCLPPWLPGKIKSSEICEAQAKVKMPDSQTMKEIKNEINKYLSGKDFFANDECKTPCVSMQIKLKQTFRGTNVAATTVAFETATEVLVTTDVMAYDIFNLVVDMGSALGLWLGLSAISIFDLVIWIPELVMRKFH